MNNVNVEPFINARRCLMDARNTLRRGISHPLALDALAHVLGALDMLELAQRELVAAARENGPTWEQVGNVYGVTRQAARQRFGGGPEVDSERAS